MALLCGECGSEIEWPEPEELKDLCNDPVFLALAQYCLGGGQAGVPGVTFDADELGEDPEED